MHNLLGLLTIYNMKAKLSENSFFNLLSSNKISFENFLIFFLGTKEISENSRFSGE